MTTTPDPLDALKFAFVLAWTRLEGHEEDHLVALRNDLEHIIAPFRVVGPDGHLVEMLYSDGRPVTVFSDIGGECLESVFPPDGYPTIDSSDLVP